MPKNTATELPAITAARFLMRISSEVGLLDPRPKAEYVRLARQRIHTLPDLSSQKCVQAKICEIERDLPVELFVENCRTAGKRRNEKATVRRMDRQIVEGAR